MRGKRRQESHKLMKQLEGENVSLQTLERRASLAQDLQPPPRHGPPPGPCHLQLVMGNAPCPSRFAFTGDSLLGHQRFWVVTTRHREPFLLPNRGEDAPCQLHSGVSKPGFAMATLYHHSAPCSVLLGLALTCPVCLVAPGPPSPCPAWLWDPMSPLRTSQIFSKDGTKKSSQTMAKA